MQDKGNSPQRRTRWQQILDPILLLNRRKLLLAIGVAVLAAALTWWLESSTGVLQTVIFVTGAALVPLYLLAALAYTIVRTQPPGRYLRINRYTLLLIPAFVAGAVLHNVVYAMFYPMFTREDGDEGVFFIAALLGIPLYFLFLLLNTIVHALRGNG